MPNMNSVPRGDLCARRRVEALAKRDDRQELLNKTIVALREERVEEVAIPGGRRFLVPVEVADAIREQARGR